MRHVRSICVGGLVCVFALLQLTRVCAAPPSWNGTPIVGSAGVAPLGRLQRDFVFLGEGLAEGATSEITEVFTELSEGIDASRPAGAVLLFEEPETFFPVIFIPVKDQEKLFAVLGSRWGWKIERNADGMYRSKNSESGIDLVARVVDRWMYISGFSHREKLSEAPADPTALLSGVDPTLTAHATFQIDQLREATRDQLLRMLIDANSASGSQSSNLGADLVKQWMVRSSADVESLSLELQCFRPLEQFHLSTRLTAIEGSDLASWIENASHRMTIFSRLPTSEAILSAVSSLKLNSSTTRTLLDAWAPVASKAKAAAPSPQSRNQAESLLGRFVSQAVDSVSNTLASGEFDAGLVVERQARDQVVLLAAATLHGARVLEEVATEVGTLLQQSAEFRALEWAVGGSEDASFHQLTVPVTDENARTLFGDPATLAIGVGAERIYAAIGGDDSLELLTKAVDRSQNDVPVRGELLRISTHLAPLLATLDGVSGEDAENDKEVHEYAALIAPFQRNDAMELSLQAEDRTIEGRLRIDMGVVRMLASKLPIESKDDSPRKIDQVPGTLQLQAGDDFQWTFHTDGEVATTIDGEKRLERSINALTYDFQVTDVRSDGTMQIAAALSHVLIDKTTPEGREVFDSAHPPTPESMTAEMMLYGVVIGEPVVLTIRSDGAIAAISGVNKAIEHIVDTKVNPATVERDQAHAFVSQLLNEQGLRDSLTRGFEFYPGHAVSAGDRWTRQSENLTIMKFSLDNHYQAKIVSDEEVAISLRSQVLEPDPAKVADQPIQWDFVGSQSGSLTLDPRTGRLRLGEFTLRMDAEATFEMDGNEVSRPIVSLFKMTIGDPIEVARRTGSDLKAHAEEPVGWLSLTADVARSGWQSVRPDVWQIRGDEIVSLGGNYAKWSYIEFADRTFSDFELAADVLYDVGCNGGICFRATQGGLDGVNPSGYEVQLLGIETERNPTGSLYKMPNNGPVSGVYSARPRLGPANQWLAVRVVARGSSLSVYIDDEKVASFDDLSEPIKSGHIILQGSPEGVIRYRNVRVRPL
ncbi:MAG: DUF1080 domain-containing protein [Planctomycetaceae bacterium]|nr:DUF1080 domain-containing protein [Planctomycetales bacterium]MCB9924068.1 DUF1080 domain-containing protein [Planctomycetaceae bacterium]